MKFFRPKMVEISNFELQKSYIPQKKLRLYTKQIQPEKRRFPAKKRVFLQFF
jgi:hypothetical protein